MPDATQQTMRQKPPPSTHTATIGTIDRDPTRRDGIPCRLITFTLDDGTCARLTCQQPT
jgi:hypothetical protein